MRTIVCLDAGHAKSTPGKRSPYSANGVLPAIPIMEYDLNRTLVNKIDFKLKECGIETFIVTPETETDVSLTERYKRANRKKEKNPDARFIFVSVHANALGNGDSWNSANGWSCYTTKGQNGSDVLAECLYDEAEKIFKPMRKKIRTDNSDGDRDYEENFTVIKGANMPAILTENFFYTNIQDAEFLSSPDGLEAITDVHVNGIVNYINLKNKEMSK